MENWIYTWHVFDAAETQMTSDFIDVLIQTLSGDYLTRSWLGNDWFDLCISSDFCHCNGVSVCVSPAQHLGLFLCHFFTRADEFESSQTSAD